ncbi:DUF2442 domain-containing protein [Sphingomonas glacialis]|nr:DUF2442 domain-containing protein [Sphingomonas glacialis]
MMIKLIHIEPRTDATVRLSFSDATTARWSAADYITRDTVMTRPLADPAFFARAFIESGALAWPNGFELSADALHRRLDAAGELVRTAA